MTADHTRTALSAVSLSLSGLELGDLDPPLTRINLTRLRDVLEVATLLPARPVPLPRADLEAIALCLIATRGVLDGGHPLSGPPDLLATLTPVRVEATLRRVMDALDASAHLALRPAQGVHHA